MTLWEQLSQPESWQDFYNYKIEKQHLSVKEQEVLAEYISQEQYGQILSDIISSENALPLPYKKEVNKSGSSKKRVVYSFPADFNTLLKMISYLLFRYDHLFADNCYAFRRNYGVKNAIQRIRSTRNIHEKYCLKVDIHNYFNSIDVPLLLEKLTFLKEQDCEAYTFLEQLLLADRAVFATETSSCILEEKRGAMAGTPFSPFLANVYLMETDHLFAKENVLYFRYSDDILLFADSEEALQKLQAKLYEQLAAHHLQLNPSKVHMSKPGEAFEFLGFQFRDGQVDLSDATIRKIKAKIKRKAHALHKWMQQKNLPGDRAAKGFLRAMNRKFYDSGDGTEFSWSRWFFPCLTTDTGLKEIDAYMQQYTRYCVTGRHYKGNYRISYEQMKEWGYRSLVHEYYATHKL